MALFLRSLIAAHLKQSVTIGYRHLCNNAPNSLQFCVVGGGPAGFYVTDKLLKKYGERARVDVVERLPTPFGLVRSGVAPDHQDTKLVINQFTAVAKDPRVNFFGNVTVGHDLDIHELRQLYHAVVLAYGAESDRRLNIEGEDLPGVFSARQFVWWYNAHPDAVHLPVSLKGVSSVALVGCGNVAVDIARLLLSTPERLSGTDIASAAMRQLLTENEVRDVHIVARRGPVQAACTPKELKELLNLPGIAARATGGQLDISEADAEEMKAVRMRRRVYDLISTAVREHADRPEGAKRLHFQFYRAPVALLADGPGGRVAALRVERTALVGGSGGGRTQVQRTGEVEDIPCQLVLKSIGYRSLPMEGVPFDHSAGVVPNVAGRVLTPGNPEDSRGGEGGLYVAGWLKRGPSGIIGTNSVDAEETVASIAQDLEADQGLSQDGHTPLYAACHNGHKEVAALLLDGGAQVEKPNKTYGGREALQRLLATRGVQPVSFPGWCAIDSAELEAGRAAGKVREKMVNTADMLRTALSAATVESGHA